MWPGTNNLTFCLSVPTSGILTGARVESTGIEEGNGHLLPQYFFLITERAVLASAPEESAPSLPGQRWDRDRDRETVKGKKWTDTDQALEKTKPCVIPKAFQRNQLTSDAQLELYFRKRKGLGGKIHPKRQWDEEKSQFPATCLSKSKIFTQCSRRPTFFA